MKGRPLGAVPPVKSEPRWSSGSSRRRARSGDGSSREQAFGDAGQVARDSRGRDSLGFPRVFPRLGVAWLPIVAGPSRAGPPGARQECCSSAQPPDHLLPSPTRQRWNSAFASAARRARPLSRLNAEIHARNPDEGDREGGKRGFRSRQTAASRVPGVPKSADPPAPPSASCWEFGEFTPGKCAEIDNLAQSSAAVHAALRTDYSASRPC